MAELVTQSGKVANPALTNLDILDSADIVRSMGRSIENGHLDVNSALNNLSAALRKLEAASEHLRK